MAKLIVKRTSEWKNRWGKIRIYLDGEKIGVISNGQVKAFDIVQGEHKLKTSINWVGSETISFEISESKTQEFELSGSKNGEWLGPIAITVNIFYLAIQKQLNVDPLAYFVVLFNLSFLLNFLYHITIGRNKYLRLRRL